MYIYIYIYILTNGECYLLVKINKRNFQTKDTETLGGR